MTTATFGETPKLTDPVSYAADFARLWMEFAVAAPRALLSPTPPKSLPRDAGTKPTPTAAAPAAAARPARAANTAAKSVVLHQPTAAATRAREAGPPARTNWYRLPDFAVPAPSEPEASGSWYRTPAQRAARASVQPSPLDPFGFMVAFAPARPWPLTGMFPTAAFPTGAGTFDAAAWAALLGASALPADFARLLWPMAPSTAEPQLPLPLPFMAPPQPTPPAETLSWLAPMVSMAPIASALQGPALAPVPQIAFRTASGHAVARVVAQSATTAATLLLAVAQVANQIGPFLPSEMLLPTFVS